MAFSSISSMIETHPFLPWFFHRFIRISCERHRIPDDRINNNRRAGTQQKNKTQLVS